MAADILLYRPAEVPVGDDQRQHVELTRDVAQRFNRTYGAVLTVPRAVHPAAGARVMDLADPTRKMSKSATNDAGVIRLLDGPDVVRRKVARAVTDSDTGPDAVRPDRAHKPGVTNLLDVAAACTGLGVEEVAEQAPTYGALKRLVTDAVVAVLDPLQQRYRELAADRAGAYLTFKPAALASALQNFEQMLPLLKALPDDSPLRALHLWTRREHAARLAALEARKRGGFVRECHGDLHLGNLVLIEDEVLPFDAIEFNDTLRWIDVANDMAFAWMDLLAHARPGLANVLLSAWLDASGDVSSHTVWTFFASYRAGVRAKVAAIRLGQLGGTGASPEADACLAEAQRYLALARDIAHPPAPRLLITHGLSGSGKTWASSRWLAAETSGRAIRLRSDVERKRLHGMSALAASGSGLNSGLYTAKSHGDTYGSLLSRARMLLADGWTVLVDAAFLRAAERAEFAALAQGAGVPFHILACEAPVEVLRQRITERQARGADASEATVEVLEKQLGWLEPLDANERARVI